MAEEVKKRSFINWKTIALFLAVMGPGIITASVDNDAGGITTYTLAGAHFGYSLLWTLVPITIALIVVQEMCARMGVVTGKGLADLIRESFGVRADRRAHRRPDPGQHGQYDGGVRGRGRQHGDLRREQVHRCTDSGFSRLGTHREGHLQPGRKDIPGQPAAFMRLT